MKLIESFMLTDVADDVVAVPVGAAADKLQGVIRLNGTAADIWRGLADGKTEEAIASELVSRYDGVSLEHALESIKRVIEKLSTEGIII